MKYEFLVKMLLPFEVDLLMQTRPSLSTKTYSGQLIKVSNFSKRVGRIAHPVDQPTRNPVIVDYMTLNKGQTSRSSL